MKKYRTILRGAQNWLKVKQENFDPLIWIEKKAAYTRRKAFVELSIYAYVLGAGKESDADLSDFICNIANSPEYHRLVLRNPRQLLLYSAPLAYAIATGQATQSTVLCVDKVLSRPQVFGIERGAHRMMDLWQFLTLVERRPDWLSAKQILAFSSLAHTPSAFDCTLSEAYAFTHNVLFLKNFGVQNSKFDPGVEIALDRQYMALTLARFISEGNSDIVLELLMTAGLMEQLNGKDCQLILDWIVNRNGDCDYVSGPSFDPDENILYSGLDQEWVANYHTTLVACSALLLTERNGWLSGADVMPLFDTSIEDIIRWGEVFSLLNRYEIPKALAIIDSVTEWTEFGKFSVRCVGVHLKDITDESTGIIGYWTDEIKAAEIQDSESELDSELRHISSLAEGILSNTPEFKTNLSDTS